ncbi:hydrogen gas-evolving membrane-bound hydrogenase subunit E [Paenibacillus herberti]|uniref:Cation:proton antiporter n=1 Tax=Paenibacillus herberti TaxID=1619309 RepID=A0A229P1Y1_9BACL|nr:hydrogen gas-evolving membrane-bound hydrogenase subunit E [Paenibacillus herberti]OXM16108.1 cation:proton antiporter [Paenibacillus herberti]
MSLLHFFLLLPFLLAAMLPLLNKLTKELHPGWLAMAAPAFMLFYFLSRIPEVSKGRSLTASVPWIPSLGINLDSNLDGLGLLFALLISGIGALVVLYSISYLHPRKEAVTRFYVCLLLFMGAMLGVVLSDHLIVLYGFWELTSITSFLLIAFWHKREVSLAGALKSLLITSFGGLAMLAGFLLLGLAGGSLRVSELIDSSAVLAASPLLLPAMLLIALGVLTKSAQFPFHIWLPDAMEAPTPVSAYLHSATMVKAGLYLAARLMPIFAGQAPWYILLTTSGLITLLYGAFRAIKQTDLKALLAYSTISQLGLVLTLLGLGSVYPTGSTHEYAVYSTAAAAAALFHLVNHAAFKGALFMTAGIVDHETGTRDLRQLGGLLRFMPLTFTVALAASLSMAGVPPFGGFMSKELFFGSALDAMRSGSWGTAAFLIPVIAWTASAFTFVYSAIFVWRTFGGSRRGEQADASHAAVQEAPHKQPNDARHATMRAPVQETPQDARYETLQETPHEAPLSMLLSPMLLAAAALIFGLFPGSIGPNVLQPALDSLQPGAAEAFTELSLWHGWTPELLMTLGVFIVGGALFLIAPRVPLLNRPLRVLFSWNGVFKGGLRNADRASERLTSLYLTGSMRHYASYVFLFLIVAVAVTTFMTGGFRISFSGMAPVTVYEGIAVAALIAAALAVPFAQSRMMAIILTGTIGYLVVLFFVLFRAPDLALTQMIVETVSVTLFLLCFYHLPALKREKIALRTKLINGLIAAASGIVMTVVALGAFSGRAFPSISDYYLKNSYELAGGKNVVNVILVDFRGFDTMLEIVVLGIASYAIYGVIGLKWPEEKVVERNGLREREFRLIYEDARSNDVILQTLSKVILFLILTFSFYILFAGHHEPGGGFIGALMTSSALVLLSIAFGAKTVRSALPLNFRIVTACGIAVALLTGIGSFAFNMPFLSHAFGYVYLPIFGKNELATAVLFDLGVYLTVVGITMTIILAIGRDK